MNVTSTIPLCPPCALNLRSPVRHNKDSGNPICKICTIKANARFVAEHFRNHKGTTFCVTGTPVDMGTQMSRTDVKTLASAPPFMAHTNSTIYKDALNNLSKRLGLNYFSRKLSHSVDSTDLENSDLEMDSSELQTKLEEN